MTYDMHMISAQCVACDLPTAAPCVSICAGDNMQCSHEIAKILKLCLSSSLLLLVVAAVVIVIVVETVFIWWWWMTSLSLHKHTHTLSGTHTHTPAYPTLPTHTHTCSGSTYRLQSTPTANYCQWTLTDLSLYPDTPQPIQIHHSHSLRFPPLCCLTINNCQTQSLLQPRSLWHTHVFNRNCMELSSQSPLSCVQANINVYSCTSVCANKVEQVSSWYNKTTMYNCNTHIPTPSCTQTHTHAYLNAHTHTHSCTHTYTLSLSHTHMYTHRSCKR